MFFEFGILCHGQGPVSMVSGFVEAASTFVDAAKYKQPAKAVVRRALREQARQRKLGKVVEDHDSKEEHKEDKGHLINALFDLLLDIAAHHSFDQQHQHEPAIQDGNWKKVDDS